MATQLSLQENHAILANLVRQWDRRLRLQQSILWLPRAVMPGLALGIALAVISRLRVFLLPEQILIVTIAAVLLGLFFGALLIWLRRRPMIASARRFDVILDLDERISTALELLEGRIRSNDELVALQVEDARLQARAAHVSDRVPIRTAPRDWMIVLLLAAVLALLLLLPNPQSELIAQNAAQTAAIEEAAEEVREITEEIAADSSLSDPEREQLLEVLETSTQTLQQQNITPEEAFAALSDVQSALRNQANLFNQRVNNSQSAFDSASEQLGDFTPGDQEQTSAQDLISALQTLAENMQNQSQEQREQAAQQLSQAAQSMENTNPQAAQSMQQAAQAMQNGDQQNAQQQLQQAQESLGQQAQQQNQQQQAAQQMNQQAQNVQQAAQQVSQAAQEQSQQQGQQQSQQQQGQPQSQQQQSQQSQQGQQGEESQQGQQGGQQGQQQSQQAQAQQPGEQGQQGQQGEQAGAESQQQNNAMSGAALSSGAGDSPGEQSQNAQQGQRPSQPPNQDNNPDGQGEREYEPIYAPQRIGENGNNGEDIVLEPDGENAPVIEDNFTENPTGNTTVPYNQVYSNYQNAANQALDSGYVPLGLKDIVRNYFTSLEPSD
jgi:hypothetical protein